MADLGWPSDPPVLLRYHLDGHSPAWTVFSPIIMPSTFSMACNALRNTGQVNTSDRHSLSKREKAFGPSNTPETITRIFKDTNTKKASWNILGLHEDGTVHQVTSCLLCCFLSLIVHKAITWVQVLSTLQRARSTNLVMKNVKHVLVPTFRSWAARVWKPRISMLRLKP